MKKKIFAIFTAIFLTFGSSFAKQYVTYWKCDSVIYKTTIIAGSIEEARSMVEGVHPCD